MRFRFGLKFISVLVLVGTLAACEDSESRAERYYQSGLALLEEGDTERALIEFRNVFNLNGAHREARSTYARLIREQGKINEAFGQYRLLVEQYPDDLEGQIALSEMSFRFAHGTERDEKKRPAEKDDAWDQFYRYSDAATEIAPQDPRAQAIEAVTLFTKAERAKDGPARDAAHEKVVVLAAEQPDNGLLQQTEIDGYLSNDNYAKALEALDRAIASDPDNLQFALFRIRLLHALDDMVGLEQYLRDMVAKFPEDTGFQDGLLSFYASEGQMDKAEAFLREIADPNAEEPKYYIALLQLIGQERGVEAVIAELDKVIPTVDDPSGYQAMRAGIAFDQGQRTEAIAALEAVIAGTEPSAQQRDMKINLANMLLSTGNDVGARQLVEQVLAEDATHVPALRMRATWQIENGDATDAITTLRSALDQDPQDVASMVLMSSAYMRENNRDLARDFLSLATDASDQAPEQARTYARFLVEEERYVPAERVLVASLRKNLNHEGLLVDLGRIYLQLEDFGRMEQTIRQLRALPSDTAIRAAAGLQAGLIEKREGREQAIDYLEDISKDWDNALAARGAVIRARISGGDAEGALESAKAALAEDPDDPGRRNLMASTQATLGMFDEAEAGYRALLSENPNLPSLWLQLVRVLTAQDNPDGARQVLADGLDANPDAPDLLWARASQLEKAGDIDGAIEIYERLYITIPDSVIVANNLASLLATSRDDAESLERAATVGQRLRGMRQVAFRDTWGWIAFLQGDLEDALEHLEPAASGLPDDPQVQYHLGRVYEALSRPEDAKAQYEKALTLADPEDARASIADARTRLDALKAQ